MYTTIISTADLSSHLNDPAWVIVDCRFDLARPEWGFSSYLESHIPNAVYASIDHDLSGPIQPDSGRHPLPDLKLFTARLEQWGISNSSQVVVYDTSGGSNAARLWWLLRYLGHKAVAVLDGGFPKWQSENRPVSAGPAPLHSESFLPATDSSMVADITEVERIRQNSAYCLIDSRAPERYRGEIEPIDPIAGHIPGAVNRFYANNLRPDNTFLSPSELRQQFESIIHTTRPENVVVYCGSGITAAHNVFALELAGLSGVRLYPGSWSEWIRDRKRPVS